MKHEEVVYSAKHDWTDSKCYIAALFILGILGFSATAVMVYSYINGFADIGNSAAIATGTGIGMIGVTQNYGFNFDPSSLTKTITVPNPQRDPLSGAIYCTGPNNQQYAEGEQYDVSVTPCQTATCTCGQQQCQNNAPTCCVADAGTCAFGDTNCQHNGDICTCKNDGSYENCCPPTDPCQCGISCTDNNGNQICEGATYTLPSSNPCVTFTCTCGGSCVPNPPTCCLDKNGNTCSFGATNCLRDINGIEHACTCDNDGGGSSCCPTSDPCNCQGSCNDINGNKVCSGTSYETAGDACGTYQCVCDSTDPCTPNARTCCLDKDGNTCALGSSGCKRLNTNGDEVECECNAAGDLINCVGPPPTTCPDSYGGECAFDQPGCKRIINGADYLCTCKYDATNNKFKYEACTPDSGGGGSTPATTECSPHCFDNENNRKCAGDTWTFPFGPSYPCYECTCTCGQPSCPCTYSTTLCP